MSSIILLKDWPFCTISDNVRGQKSCSGSKVRIRVRDSTFSKSELGFVISIFFYPRKILFLIFKLFFRRDPNSPGLPKILKERKK
ncbi:unnamed protein product [Meloidogyne enterolobii]|uniref:Uncharacterized protein n=1 Tax=Meloidogyne enterolobii TaxID=390850 RepID=A0ACB1B626_MELEN